MLTPDLKTFSFQRGDRTLILLFIVSAAVAAWISYDRSAATWKLITLVIGAGLYFFFGQQPNRRAFLLSSGTIALGCGCGLYFLLSNDWYRWPVDYALISKVVAVWLDVRPDLGLPSIHPNMMGGTLVLLLPFALVEAIFAWNKRKRRLLILMIAALLLMGFALILTSSRAAWLALAIGLSVAGIVWFIKRYKLPRVLSVITSFLFLALAINLVSEEMDFHSWLQLVPGMESRSDLLRNSFNLAREFVFTGGGLAAFPGLYSRYLLVIPDMFLEYSHNLYMDLLIEQGFWGFFTFLALMVIAFGRTIQVMYRSDVRTRAFLLSLAVLAGLLMTLIHGIIDDPLYGGLGNPLLFLLPGWALFLFYAYPDFSMAIERKRTRVGWKMGTLLVIGVILFVGLRGREFLAGMYANIGSIEMARIDLKGWPDEVAGWDEKTYPAELSNTFHAALKIDPSQTTAHYRLGLIAMNSKDFRDAISHFSSANVRSFWHRGVVKNLGYGYVWEGDIGAALPLLENIPEAREELRVYEWWWGTQGEAELAQQASRAAALLSIAN